MLALQEFEGMYYDDDEGNLVGGWLDVAICCLPDPSSYRKPDQASHQ